MGINSHCPWHNGCRHNKIWRSTTLQTRANLGYSGFTTFIDEYKTTQRLQTLVFEASSIYTINTLEQTGKNWKSCNDVYIDLGRT